MEQVKVSSKGQIAIPKPLRDALNLAVGTKLNVSVRGQEIILSKEPSWKNLRGAGSDVDLIAAYADYKKEERDLEDPRP
ncbi:MAG: AbrB/MazE/SpoVT family DNA-binding domain-containing protein [Bryobacteraceae bacterium]